MKLVLISDVHSNLEALDCVLREARGRWPAAKIVCAGDIVGYGPDPEACIDRLRTESIPAVMGNHEEMVLGIRDFSRCVYAGILAARWTRRTLSDQAWAFLESLPHQIELEPDIVVTHGDLVSADTYLSSAEAAERALRQLDERFPRARILICGHTHHAAAYNATTGFQSIRAGCELDLASGTWLVNPGAVGQSRDGRPLARYAVYDTETAAISYRELEYEHQKTVSKLREAGLVPSVVLAKPTGIARYVEALKKRWARSWAADPARAWGPATTARAARRRALSDT